MTDFASSIAALSEELLIEPVGSQWSEPDPVPQGLQEDHVAFLAAFHEFASTENLVVEAREDAPPYRDEDGFLSLVRIFTLGGDERDRLPVFIEDYEGRLPEGMVPIGNDPYDNLFCMAGQGRGPDGVWFWRHDAEGPEQSMEAMTLVADSFKDLLARIRVDQRHGTVADHDEPTMARVRWIGGTTAPPSGPRS